MTRVVDTKSRQFGHRRTYCAKRDKPPRQPIISTTIRWKSRLQYQCQTNLLRSLFPPYSDIANLLAKSDLFKSKCWCEDTFLNGHLRKSQFKCPVCKVILNLLIGILLHLLASTSNYSLDFCIHPVMILRAKVIINITVSWMCIVHLFWIWGLSVNLKSFKVNDRVCVNILFRSYLYDHKG